MFTKVRIKSRLAAGFAVILLLVIGLSAISVAKVDSVNDKLTVISTVNSVKQRYAINFRGSVHDRAIALRDVVLLRSEDERRGPLSDITRLTDQYTQSAGPLDAMMTPDKNPGAAELAILASIKDVERRTLPVLQEVIARKQQGDDAGAEQMLMNQARPLFVEWLARINQFIDQKEAANKTITEEVHSATGNFHLLTITLCAVVLAIGTGIAAWSIAGVAPINALADTMKRLASGEDNVSVPYQARGDEIGSMATACEIFRRSVVEREAAKARDAADQTVVTEGLARGLQALQAGDLTATIDQDFPPAYAELKTSFNSALASLRQLIGSVVASSEQIGTGSAEIAQAAEDLARRTENTAASLEETSAAIIQMDNRLRATAAAAGQTVQRADQTIATVSSGRSVADEAVQAMGRVSESAKGIDSVIEGLDKVAFQTRVLAMNAAVEAGRAGEAGRGFAVVADLVSALAMRAEEEAKLARSQLTVTQADIGTAVGAVQRVDGALANISGDVGEVHDLLRTMADDNQAQALAITEINVAVSSMDQATQQNAAMVEQTSAAARSLLSEVAALTTHASEFKVESRKEHAPRHLWPDAQRTGAPASVHTLPTAPAPTRSEPVANPVHQLQRKAVAAGGGRAQDDWAEF